MRDTYNNALQHSIRYYSDLDRRRPKLTGKGFHMFSPPFTKVLVSTDSFHMDFEVEIIGIEDYGMGTRVIGRPLECPIRNLHGPDGKNTNEKCLENFFVDGKIYLFDKDIDWETAMEH